MIAAGSARSIAARSVGAALVLVGTGAVIISTGYHGHPTARIVGGDQPVNLGARNPADITANNSPTLTRNPRNTSDLALVNRIDSPSYSCALDVSHDGGARWSALALPNPPGEEHKCYEPDATFAADGTLYVSYATLRGAGNVPHAVWLVRSLDAGRTFSMPKRVIGPLAFQVRLTSDPGRPHRVYLTWLQASDTGLYRFTGPGNPIDETRSDDAGATWGSPVRVSDPARGRVVAPSPAVGPGGELYVLYLDIGDDRLDYEGAHGGLGGPPYAGRFALVLGRSRDAGSSWQSSVVDQQIVPTGRFIVFLAPFPSVAVDPRSGRVYVAFQDRRLGSSDVYVWSLAPGARRWTGPTRVNDTAKHDRTSQYMPKLAVAPNGRLDVVYYDRRTDPRNRLTAVSLQSSFDQGRSFSRHAFLTDRPFDSQVGPGSERGLPDLGSRLGLVSSDAGALAAWTDTRAGTPASGKQDIGFARVELSSPARLAQPVRLVLRYGGLALALVGLGLLLPVRRHRQMAGQPSPEG